MRLRLAPLCLLIGLLVSGCVRNSPTSPSSTTGGKGGGGGASTGTRTIRLTGSLVYGTVRVGSSLSATMTIHNDGNAALTFTGITGPGLIMAAIDSTPTRGTVAPGGQMDVTITFYPIVAQRYHGNLRVTSDATVGTGAIEFDGYGSLNGVPIFSTSGAGDGSFDLPAFVDKVRIAGNYTGSSTPLTVWVGNQNVACGVVIDASCNLLLDITLGTSVGRTTSDNTKLVGGGSVTKTITVTTGAAWTITEAR
jgi:HYDIN/CFA65/VesB-like, Ig-like domain